MIHEYSRISIFSARPLASVRSKMVYDRLRGVERESPSLAKEHQDSDEISRAEENILCSIAAKTPKEHEIENTQRVAGFTIGTISMLGAQFLTHPLTIFRRQCQVNHCSSRYHIFPFTVFRILIKLERNQGHGPLWKGCGSMYFVCAINLFGEAAIGRITNLPQEKLDGKSSIKDVGSHLLLKGLSLVISMPVAVASLVQTVKTESIPDNQGVMDNLKDSLYRMVGWDRSMGRHGRLLPMWTIVIPTVLHGLLKYLLETFVQHLVLLYMKSKGLYSPTTAPGDRAEEDTAPPIGMTHTYFPELSANFVAFIVPDVILYPLETVLYRLYIQGTRTIIDDLDAGCGVVPLCTKYDGMFDCFRTIWREEGFGGFYKGFGALILQCLIHFLILKLTKWVYERVSQDFQGK